MNLSPDLKTQVIRLFEQMDRAYDDAAKKSGFVCNGCEDNCCMTRFFHHTLVEYLYLKSGLAELAPEVQAQVKAQAKNVVEQNRTDERVMCPLNREGRCTLYAHRPMICRLHGIAHTLRRPDGHAQAGPGCDDYYTQCGQATEARLDRTPLYIEMARLEQQLRRELGFSEKIRMTIAEIILDDGIRVGD